ncbi:MAG: hypothetical protein MUP66_01530 [Candidatus Nanohaloarchaeota archaeon QJJ-5]|nr:hypothetical protein [Candidatus Nanohaloarchaeota archaeon QJJ-5]
METLTVDELVTEARVGGTYRLKGWLYQRHAIDEGIRLIIRDTTGLISCDVEADVVEENTMAIAGGVELHSRLTLEGRLHPDEDVDAGRSFLVKDITVDNESETYQTAEEGFAADVDRFWVQPEQMNRATMLYQTTRETIEAALAEEARYIALPPDDGQPTYPWGYLEAAVHGVGPVFTERQYPTHRWFLQTTDTTQDALIKKIHSLLPSLVRSICDEQAETLAFFDQDPDDLERNSTDIKEEQPETVQHWDPEEPHQFSAHLSLPTIMTAVEDERPFVARQDEHPTSVQCFAPGGHGLLMDGFVLEADPMTVMQRIQDQGTLPETYRRIIESKRHGNIRTAGLTINAETLVSWMAGMKFDDLRPFHD